MVTVQDGHMMFRLICPWAWKVVILGDFNGWCYPWAMQPGSNGYWTYQAQVPPGEYRFRYLIDDCQWLTDYAAYGVKYNLSYNIFESLVYVPPPKTSCPKGLACPKEVT